MTLICVEFDKDHVKLCSTRYLFDVGAIILSSPIWIPLLSVAALAISLTGMQPFYAHLRVGKNGKEFKCWKLRTMTDTNQVIDQASQRAWELFHKLPNDLRITPLGHILRRCSIDELPQIWNVLRGEMALIGPRPITTPELTKYGSYAEDYLSVLPGITGPVQTMGRHRLTLAQRAEIEQTYLRKRSLGTDIAIFLRTIGTLIKCDGA